MIGARQTGDWKKALRITGGMTGLYLKASRQAMMQEAHFFRAKMIEGLRTGSPGGKKFAPLSSTTLAIRKFRGRGGTKPLIVTGGLRNSIRVKKIDTDSVFVGVLRTGKGGANVAQMMEDGHTFSVPITKKSRRFLMAVFRKFGTLKGKSAGGAPQGKKGKSGVAIAIIRIPARPFIAPVAEKYGGAAQRKRFVKTLAAQMAFQFGS